MFNNMKNDKKRMLNIGYLLSYILIASISLFMLIVYGLRTGQRENGIEAILLCIIGAPHAVRGIVYNQKVNCITGLGFVLVGLYHMCRYVQLLL